MGPDKDPYRWLEEEIKAIQTRRFHVIHADEGVESQFNAVERLPSDYKAFIQRFGSARLYRSGDAYELTVSSNPQKISIANKNTTKPHWRFGAFGDCNAYFAELTPSTLRSPVYEQTSKGIVFIAEDFETWLRNRANTIRRRIGKKRWHEILAGPKAFTPAEQIVRAARKLYGYRLIKSDINNNFQFEVTNNSTIRIPFLSIGIRSKDRTMVGGVWLPVENIGPGQKALIEKTIYRGLLPADQLEVFDLPDPEPEDRDRYWEFRTISTKLR